MFCPHKLNFFGINNPCRFRCAPSCAPNANSELVLKLIVGAEFYHLPKQQVLYRSFDHNNPANFLTGINFTAVIN